MPPAYAYGPTGVSGPRALYSFAAITTASPIVTTYTAQMMRNNHSPLKALCAVAAPVALGVPADFWEAGPCGSVTGAGMIAAPVVPRSFIPPEAVLTPAVAERGKCLSSEAGTAEEVVSVGCDSTPLEYW